MIVIVGDDDPGDIGNSERLSFIGATLAQSLLDYGDAPDTSNSTGTGDYQTLKANGGPSHIIDSDIYIGSTVPDADTDGFANGTDANDDATDDDTEGTADEGSITFGTLTTADANYSLTGIAVTNATGENATLFGWIDFDQNGSFDEDELATATVADSDTTKSLTWSSLPGITAGTTYARFRLATTGDLTAGSDGGGDEASLGAAGDGEVEDYTLTIQDVTVGEPLCDIPVNLLHNGAFDDGLNGFPAIGGWTLFTYFPTHPSVQNPSAAPTGLTALAYPPETLNTSTHNENDSANDSLSVTPLITPTSTLFYNELHIWFDTGWRHAGNPSSHASTLRVNVDGTDYYEITTIDLLSAGNAIGTPLNGASVGANSASSWANSGGIGVYSEWNTVHLIIPYTGSPLPDINVCHERSRVCIR